MPAVSVVALKPWVATLRAALAITANRWASLRIARAASAASAAPAWGTIRPLVPWAENARIPRLAADKGHRAGHGFQRGHAIALV